MSGGQTAESVRLAVLTEAACRVIELAAQFSLDTAEPGFARAVVQELTEMAEGREVRQAPTHACRCGASPFMDHDSLCAGLRAQQWEQASRCPPTGSSPRTSGARCGARRAHTPVLRGSGECRGTDPEFIASLEARWGPFTLDVAAAEHNAKAPRWFTALDDGLRMAWSGLVWCNPPYSNVRSWVEKAWAEWALWPAAIETDFHRHGTIRRRQPGPTLIAMLLPANRVEQKWWQELVEPFRDRPGSPLTVEFLPGRMRFTRPDWTPGPKGDRPPFGCCLLIWKDPTMPDLTTPAADPIECIGCPDCRPADYQPTVSDAPEVLAVECDDPCSPASRCEDCVVSGSDLADTDR